MDIKKLNSDVDLSKLPEGTTILIPANKLSARDKEILDGIGPKSYRLYPVRKGEKIADIMIKRGILRTEMEQLNPGINLDRIKGVLFYIWPVCKTCCLRRPKHLRSEHQILKLPANKFTKREKEMLTGSGLVPPEFFASGKAYGFGFVAGTAMSWVVQWVVRWVERSATLHC